MAKVVKKGKVKRKPKKPSRRWEKYKDGKPTARFCPRCGLGIFLAKSKSGDRLHCGKCHYTEFLKVAQKQI